MPDTTSPIPTEAPPTKGGTKRLVVVAVLCAAILAVGFVLGGRVTGGSAATPPVTTEAPAAVELLGEVIELDAVNINLAGGHYLRIAVSLGLGAESVETDAEGHGGAEDGPSIPTAPAADLVLSTFAGRDMDALATPEGREQARLDLVDGIEDYYGEVVETVFFREFVMQ